MKRLKVVAKRSGTALWDLLRYPGHAQNRWEMTHNEFVDYLHARFKWALVFNGLSVILWAVLFATTSGPHSTVRIILGMILLQPAGILFLTLGLLFQQCGWFENTKHPETIPVGTRCPLCGEPLETGDRIMPTYGSWEEPFRHADCEDPKGINIEWLSLTQGPFGKDATPD